MSEKPTDVAILTPIAEEWHAVAALLEGATRRGDDQTLPSLEGWMGSHRVVCVLCGKGEGNTAAAVQLTSELWRPRWIFIVGLAGGFPEQQVHKGDLVIAQFVFDFEFGKLKNGAFVRRPEYDYACDRSLLGHAEILATNKAKPWLSFISLKRPDSVPVNNTRVHLGYIASSNKVIDDPTSEMYTAVKAIIPEVHAVEMEASGAGAAVRLKMSRRTLGILVVRGISDEPGLGLGTDERAAWKDYAASAAAAFTKALLLSLSPSSSRLAASTASTEISPQPSEHMDSKVESSIQDPAVVDLKAADAAAIKKYCEQHLRVHGRGSSAKQLLDDASELAFRRLVRSEKPSEGKREDLLWTLANSQAEISNFLVANHVATVIQRVACGNVKAERDLYYALPASVTSYLKQMMGLDPRLELSVLNATRSISDRLDIAARLNLYYLLGRVQDAEARHAALIFLSEAKMRLLDRVLSCQLRGRNKTQQLRWSRQDMRTHCGSCEQYM